jgi:hypothetical protein
MSAVKPRWEIRYKVIGYTVHYQITLNSVLAWTLGSVENSGMLSINSSIFGLIDANGRKLPKPKLVNSNQSQATSVYPVSPNATSAGYKLYGQNSVPFAEWFGAVAQPTFGGSGVAVWRNARNNNTSGQPYPLPSAGTAPTNTPMDKNSPILVTPISAVFTQGHPYTQSQPGTNSDTWIHLYKIGTPAWPQYGANATNGFNIHNSMFRLWNLDGKWDDSNTGGLSGVGGAMLQMDFMVSGQYELDPFEHWNY